MPRKTDINVGILKSKRDPKALAHISVDHIGTPEKTLPEITIPICQLRVTIWAAMETRMEN